MRLRNLALRTEMQSITYADSLGNGRIPDTDLIVVRTAEGRPQLAILTRAETNADANLPAADAELVADPARDRAPGMLRVIATCQALQG